MHNPSLHSLVAAARVDQLRREAEAARLAAAASANSGSRSILVRWRAPRELEYADARAVTIRWAFPDDAIAVDRLAGLDSWPAPRHPLLVAEVEGELWAALSLRNGRAIADPFRLTDGLVELLRARADQLRDIGGRPPRGLRRLARWRAPASALRARPAGEEPR
jgi:hypothetical protein